MRLKVVGKFQAQALQAPALQIVLILVDIMENGGKNGGKFILVRLLIQRYVL